MNTVLKTVAVNTANMTFTADLDEKDVVVIKDRADVEKLETKQMLALFNSVRQTPLKKFDSRAIGVQRLIKMINEDGGIPVARAKPAEIIAKPKADVVVPTVKADVVDKVSKPARLRTDEPAVTRIINYGKKMGTFSLEQAEKDLGIKPTCMRTHMSFINSNDMRFEGVKFIGDRKTKTYSFRLGKAPRHA